MVVVVQLVRTPDCGSGGRRFESGLPPKLSPQEIEGFFVLLTYYIQLKKLFIGISSIDY